MTTTILLKNSESTQKFGALIDEAKQRKLISNEDSVGYNLSTDYESWAQDINTNPESHQKHLAPTTADALKSMFANSFPENTVEIDCYFGRTRPEVIRFILNLCLDFKDDIEAIKDGRIMIERSGLSDKELEAYAALEPKNDTRFKPTLNKNRIAKESRPTSGIFSAYTRSGDDVVHFLFGNTENMTCLLDDEYVDHYDNQPYKNEDGETFVLLPLMPLGASSRRVINHIHSNLAHFSSVSFYRLMEAAYPGNLEIPYSKEFLTDESTSLLNDTDAIELLYDGINKFKQLNGDPDIRAIKVSKCKRNGKVEISVPSYINGLNQFQPAIELALSCIKHRKIGFYKKIATGSNLKVITS